MAATSGRFKDGKYKGWRWQVYPDPESYTGYTRKIWNPADTSNGGRPVELFGPHDIELDRENDAAEEGKRATAAAAAVQSAAVREDTRKKKEDEANKLQEFTKYKLDREDTQAQKDRNSRMDIAKLDRKTQLQLASQRVKEDRRQFDLTFGLDVINSNAKMRGPLNAFQGFQSARATADAGFSPFAAALRPGGNTAYGGGQAKAGGPPVPLTVGTMADEIAGGKAAYGSTSALPGIPGVASASGGQAVRDAYGRAPLSPEQQAQLAPIAQTFQNGLANAKQGQIENLTPGELAAMTSGGDYLGYDTDSELEFWKRSRPGQRSALAA